MKSGPRFSAVSVICGCILFSQFFLLHSTKSEAPPRIILEVINKHFTIGLKIPSVYLRAFSDGTVECHTVRYTGHEADIVKRNTLTPDELSTVRAILENQELLDVKKRYELVNPVIDSWMEWDIAVPHNSGTERIRVLNFSPGSAWETNTPYPDALGRLGCSIWKLRYETYGDEIYENKPSYLADGCKNALTSPSMRRPVSVKPFHSFLSFFSLFLFSSSFLLFPDCSH